MEKNVGGIDRTLRIVFGALLGAFGVAGYIGLMEVAMGPAPQALTSLVLAAVGVVLLLTGVTQKCMINSMLGRDTCEK